MASYRFRVLPVFSQFFWPLAFIFLGVSEIVFGVITDNQPLKSVKTKDAMLFKLFWYNVFVLVDSDLIFC